MTALQIKDCPTEVYEALRRCATRENRSISQQALTILESYLGLRKVGEFTKEEGWVPAQDLPPTNYAEKRKRIFERINKRVPIPVSPEAPSTASILADLRETEAR